MTLASRVALQHAERLIAEWLEEIRARLKAEPGLRADYLDLVRTLAAILPATAPEASGDLLTTGEMAAKLGMSAKSLLRYKSRGEIRPAVERGKCIRWSGRERL